MSFFKVLAISLTVTFALLGCSASSPRLLRDPCEKKGGDLVGKANNSRPEELKYNKLPDSVRYVLASDSQVVAAAELLKANLNGSQDSIKFAQYLFIMPGMWKIIEGDTSLAQKFRVKKDKMKLKVRKKTFKLYYAIPKEPKSTMKAWVVAKAQMTGGGNSVRAMKASEMSMLYKFSPFELVEPLFVVNDKYIVGFNKNNELEVLDELSYYQSMLDQIDDILYGK